MYEDQEEDEAELWTPLAILIFIMAGLIAVPVGIILRAYWAIRDRGKPTGRAMPWPRK